MSTLLTESHGFLTGVDGIRLHYRAWEVSRPRAALLLLHGLGGHCGRFERFAVRMVGYGFSAYGLDLRGHGRSDGRRGHVTRFDVYLQEVERFRREVAGLSDPGCPLVLVGHSLGGLVALRWVEEYGSGVAGAVLSSPWLAAAAVPVPRWKTLAAPVLSRLLPALPTRTRLSPDLLSHDDGVVARYRDDPLVHDLITPRLFTEVGEAIGLAVRRSDRIGVPLLFLLGGEDRLARPDRTLAFARALDLEGSVAMFPGLYHDVLNETGRDAVEDRIRDWLAATLA